MKLICDVCRRDIPTYLEPEQGYPPLEYANDFPFDFPTWIKAGYPKTKQILQHEFFWNCPTRRIHRCEDCLEYIPYDFMLEIIKEIKPKHLKHFIEALRQSKFWLAGKPFVGITSMLIVKLALLFMRSLDFLELSADDFIREIEVDRTIYSNWEPQWIE